MASKWVKAAFLVVLAIVIAYYADGFVEDLRSNTSTQYNIDFAWTWDLLTILLWILVAWLLVYSLIIVVLSFRGDAYTMTDLMNRLRIVEKKVDSLRAKEKQIPVLQQRVEEAPPVVVEEEPPPPG